MSLTVLVVDDDANIRDICRLYLTQDGFRVDEAADGRAGLEAIARRPPDVVVLDIMLPEVDGIAVLTEIRRRDQWLPVLLLTALGDEEERIKGLTLGADDYLTKPFSPRELVARVRALVRRSTLVPPSGQVWRVPGLVVDEGRRQAWRDGEPLALTPREFDLLAYFIRHPNQTLSRSQLLENVWGFDFEGEDRTVDVHITRLRAKLEDGRGGIRYLHTVWGVGYRFEVVGA
ncbi:MAG: response regulator transcription factor [Actinomycetia bacterium]|nr:response regulator transcription factor [Actinomycetes bacterium]